MVAQGVMEKQTTVGEAFQPGSSQDSRQDADQGVVQIMDKVPAQGVD